MATKRASVVLTALSVGAFALELIVAQSTPAGSQSGTPITAITSPDASGQLRTIFTGGATLDLSNPFFQSLGTNGRRCATCHVPSLDWTITPAYVQAVFAATGGRDPLFAPVDGTNSPDADVSTVAARAAASSMLLTKGLIRVGIGIPAGAQFELAAVDDPYGYASANQLSLFRRPLPATNLRFLTTVMDDGRESTPPSTLAIRLGLTDAENAANLAADLKHQAVDATLGHAQASVAPADDVLSSIEAFEASTATAQIVNLTAGALADGGALGGPDALAVQPFYVGINDVLGGDRSGSPFDPSAMTVYAAWLCSSSPGRQQIARGEVVFDTKPISISGVGGLNDSLGVSTIQGTCTTCHDTPNVGNHSVGLPINIGVSDASRRTPDLPLYTLRNIATGETVQTTDPGRALITGRWADIGKVKGPVLRALAARAPYFHNGSAATLADVVSFYDGRFHIGFTLQEKSDLVAFLRAL